MLFFDKKLCKRYFLPIFKVIYKCFFLKKVKKQFIAVLGKVGMLYCKI